ncbi:MAG: ribonuclease III [Anaerolineaceae bacterium 4572_5.1]|nr:MAG: ribonuclease III [Anaerolineaceae bacterium 4572_5.1]
MSQPNGRGAAESPVSFAQRLSLPFLDDAYLLTRALTHTSYLNEHSDALDDNERLEFLGDAVLDFVVGAWLYEHCPEMREGELTKARSALVRTEQLAAFARQIDLGRAMRLGKGEQRTGGSDRSALLCATFEALVGALYLKAGLDAVTDFFFPFLDAARDEIIAGAELNDSKSLLQEWTQSQKMGIPRYELIAETGPDHAKIFEVEVYINDEVYGRGSGQSKGAAAQKAAKATMEMLGI